MVILYGSPLCKDCINCKKNFDKFNIKYEYININETLRNLKEFLHYRDSLNIFDSVKENKGIGIPLLVDENIITLDWEKYLFDLGYKDLVYEEAPTCHLDGTGC